MASQQICEVLKSVQALREAIVSRQPKVKGEERDIGWGWILESKVED